MRAIEWNTYPLSLTAIPGNRLLLHLSYDESRFEAHTIDRMLGHLERVLEQVAGDPDIRLGEMELMGPDERVLVVDKWNQTEPAYSHSAYVDELFAARQSTVAVSLRMPPDLLGRVKREAGRAGVPYQRFIKGILEAGVTRLERRGPAPKRSRSSSRAREARR